MRVRPNLFALGSVVLAACLFACGDDDGGKMNVAPGDPFDNYDEENVTVLGAPTAGSIDPSDAPDAPDAPVGESPVLVGTPEGGAIGSEVCVSDNLCEVVDANDTNWCERDGGPVDLIYVDGELVETICYPPADDTDRPVEEITSTDGGDIDVLQTANRTTVVFDEATDGMPIEGDIMVDGNNVSIYGNGPDNTIIDGDIALDGNNARLRGVTITGDLILTKNTVAVVLCRILGNVRLETMSTNNSVFAENDIFGNFTSDSNGNLFVGNDVLGNWEHSGNGNTCDRNRSFEDADGDELVSDDERGALLDCP